MRKRKRAERFVRREEVRRKTGLSDSQRDALEAPGKFPGRVPLGPRAVGWVESEIDDWIAQRVAERDDPERAAAAYDARLPAPERQRKEKRDPLAAETRTAANATGPPAAAPPPLRQILSPINDRPAAGEETGDVKRISEGQ